MVIVFQNNEEKEQRKKRQTEVEEEEEITRMAMFTFNTDGISGIFLPNGKSQRREKFTRARLCSQIMCSGKRKMRGTAAHNHSITPVNGARAIHYVKACCNLIECVCAR